MLVVVVALTSAVLLASAGEPTSEPTSEPAAAPAATAHPATPVAPAERAIVRAPMRTEPPAEPVSRFVPVPPPAPEATTKPSPSPSAGTTQAVSPGAKACDVGPAAGHAQVLVFRSSGTRASVRACSATAAGGYVTDLGPFSGYVGRSGVTSAAAKREGDGATPAGVYALRGGFGLRANPGLPQGWFVVDDADVWVDDPASPLYNTAQREPADGRWSSAEPLANAPAYNYAQVIGYNEAARPGAGSAIFLHVSTGGPTAGCVSLPTSALLDVMRWERPGAVIMIS